MYKTGRAYVDGRADESEFVLPEVSLRQWRTQRKVIPIYIIGHLFPNV
jgi:hypothetical protein